MISIVGKKKQLHWRTAIHSIPVNMRYFWNLNANTVFNSPYTIQLSAFSIFSSKLSQSFISLRLSILSKWKWEKFSNRIQDICAYRIQYYVNRRVGNTEKRSHCLSIFASKNILDPKTYSCYTYIESIWIVDFLTLSFPFDVSQVQKQRKQKKMLKNDAE